MKIGVLGPEGTNSDRAARLWRPEADFAYYGDFEDVLRAVEAGDVDVGIVPLENSLEGAIGLTMDLLLRMPLRIIGEVNLPIKHCLVGRGEDEVKIILSHPQGLAQCRQYIKLHYPKAEVRSTGSTSHAARLAQEFPEMAAVADAVTAERYNLKILAKNIQDGSDNVTRFAVVGKEMGTKTGRDKTSLAIYLDRDRPGALYSILQAFAIRGINLTRIESRPSRRGLGDYYFYIDLEGHISDPAIKDALDEIKDKAAMTRVLGSYPKAQVK